MNLLNAQFREFAGTYPRLTQRPFKHTKETKILTNEIPELLYGQLGLSEQDYKIYGSVGNGNWVEVAWLGLLDRRITESTTRGYYVVFLFDSKLENIYLCLSLGWTQFEKEFGVNEGRQKIRAYSDHYAKLLNQSGDFKPGRIDLKAKNTLGKGYESGTVLSKKYNILKLDSADLLEDINKAHTIYEKLKRIVGDSILNLSVEGYSDDSETIEFNTELAQSTFKEIDEQALNNMLEKTKDKPREVRERMIKQIVRNRKYATFIKQRNNYICELCNRKPFIQKNGQPYAEADHILPIGGKTEGPDTVANLRCLCAQCHAIITYGSDIEIRNLITK